MSDLGKLPLTAVGCLKRSAPTSCVPELRFPWVGTTLMRQSRPSIEHWTDSQWLTGISVHFATKRAKE